MWLEIGEPDWIDGLCPNCSSLFFKPEFLKDIASTYSLSIHYFTYKRKQKLIGAIAFFSKNKAVVSPVEFYYTPLWVDKSLSEPVYFEVMNSLILQLKSNFNRIAFKLPVSFGDIRPFLWENFSVENKFTHINKNHAAVKPDITKKMLLPKMAEYMFQVENVINTAIKANINFHTTLGFNKKLLDEYEILLAKWGRSGFLYAVNVYHQGQLLCAALILLDKNTKTAYQIMLSGASNDKLAHTFLNATLLDWCSQNGYNDVDFCGANIAGISVFKSYFGTELTPYFKVSYDPLLQKVKRFEKYAYLVLRKLLRR